MPLFSLATLVRASPLRLPSSSRVQEYRSDPAIHTFINYINHNTMSNAKVIIVGGGLSGLSAAHTVLERGGNVVSIYTANTRPGRD
jgi:ribulose 1,5-bisphosphate synthetase/thiazole synthase